MLERVPDIFGYYTIPLDQWIQSAVNWLVINYRPFFQAIRWPVAVTLDGVEALLQNMPPLLFLVILLVIAWWAAGWRVGLFSVVAMAFVGFLGLWSAAMTTLALITTAVFFCVIVGVPLGIIAARNDSFEAAIRPVLDAMQTTPAFVYLVPVVMLFRVGNVAGIIATVIFALPPIIRLTNLGIRGVEKEVVEAAYAFGSTPRQVLWEVQLPLAMRTIMAGLNQTLMMALSMVVIAALIGAGGLGETVYQGLGRFDVGLAAIGGIGIVILAIILDRITQALGASTRRQVETTSGMLGTLKQMLGIGKQPMRPAAAQSAESPTTGASTPQQERA